MKRKFITIDESIINECVDKCLRKYLKEHTNRMWNYTSFDQPHTIIRENTDDLQYQIDGENIVFINNKGEEVGGMCFNCTSFDGIYSEYNDSVEDFDPHIMNKFDVNDTPIVNIEDVWVNRKFQGQGLFRKELSIGLNLLRQKYNQFILRACSDNGFPENKLVEIYQDYGFVPYQETNEDGTIMYLRN